MGMFDYVDHETDCPNCGYLVTGFQSKDSDCNLKHIPVTHVNHFYASCDECDAWIDFYRVAPPTEDFLVICELKDESAHRSLVKKVDSVCKHPNAFYPVPSEYEPSIGGSHCPDCNAFFTVEIEG